MKDLAIHGVTNELERITHDKKYQI